MITTAAVLTTDAVSTLVGLALTAVLALAFLPRTNPGEEVPRPEEPQ